MSRRINLRSPYFVKVTSSSALRPLRQATLHLYVWTGTLTNRPAEPTYTIAKRINPLQDFIVFELSELARDFIDFTFTGPASRETQPVYISYLIQKENSQTSDVEIEKGLVFGLDGYEDFEEGIQATENLLVGITGADVEADILDVPTTSLAPSNAIFDATQGQSILFTVRYPDTFDDIVVGDITFPTWLNTPTGISASSTAGGFKTQTFTMTSDEDNTSTNARTGALRVTYGTATDFVEVQVSQRGTVDANPPVVQVDANGDGIEDTYYTVNIGDAVSLVAVNASDPSGGTLSYQWYMGGLADNQQIAGATNSTYIIPGAQLTAGVRDYYLRVESSVSNRFGFSQRCRIEHQVLPLGIDIRTNINGTERVIGTSNEAVTFTANVTGTFSGTATVEWFRDSNNNSVGTGTTLNINITTATTGRYFAVATAGTETATSNSIGVSLTGMPGTINRDINSTLSQPLTFGNTVGSFRDVTYTYTANVYEDLLVSDITDIVNGPAPWITASIQSHLIIGDNKVTVVRYTTNAAYTETAPRNGRKAVNFRLLSGSTIGEGNFTDFMRQNGVPSISGINLSTTSLTTAGGTVTLSVSGDEGATYSLRVNAIAPANWINESAVDVLTGTVGDNHIITIPSNTSTDNRSLNIIATNALQSANMVPGSVITQAAVSRYVNTSPQALTFPADTIRTRSQYQTITVDSNTAWTAEIPSGSNFRFVQRSLDPTANANADTLLTEIAGNTSNFTRTDTVNVWAMDNTSPVDLEASAIFRFRSGDNSVQDTVALSQSAAAARQRFVGELGGTLTSLDVGVGSANATSFGVDANTTWAISVPTGFVVSSTTGTGDRMLTVHATTAGATGTMTLRDVSGVAPNATATLSAAAGVTGLSLRLSHNSLVMGDTQVVTSTISGATDQSTVTLELFRNTTATTSGGTSLGTVSASGSFSETIDFTPDTSTVGTQYYYATATDAVGTVTSNVITIEISAAQITLTVVPDSLDFPSDGGTQTVTVSGLRAGTDYSATVAGSGFSRALFPSSVGEVPLFGTYGVRVTATSSSDTSGTLTITSGNATADVTLTRSESMVTLFPTTFSVDRTGGSQSSALSVAAGATWTAVSDASWLDLLGGTNSRTITGTGSTNVRFQVEPNYASVTRTGVITVTSGSASGTITVTQTGTTTYGGGLGGLDFSNLDLGDLNFDFNF